MKVMLSQMPVAVRRAKRTTWRRRAHARSRPGPMSPNSQRRLRAHAATAEHGHQIVRAARRRLWAGHAVGVGPAEPLGGHALTPADGGRRWTIRPTRLRWQP